MNLATATKIYAGGEGSGPKAPCPQCGPKGTAERKGKFVYHTADRRKMGEYPNKYLANVHVWKGTGARDIGGRFVRTWVELHAQPATGGPPGTLFHQPTQVVVTESHHGEADSLDYRKVTDRKTFNSLTKAHQHLADRYGITDKKVPYSVSLNPRLRQDRFGRTHFE